MRRIDDGLLLRKTQDCIRKFNLAFPSDAKKNMLRADDGPFPSAEQAFEKAKEWAIREIEQRVA
jgi:hypothetical protein